MENDGIILHLKKLSALLKGMRSKHSEDFYCLNYLHSFATKTKRELHKKYVKTRIFEM